MSMFSELRRLPLPSLRGPCFAAVTNEPRTTDFATIRILIVAATLVPRACDTARAFEVRMPNRRTSANKSSTFQAWRIGHVICMSLALTQIRLRSAAA